MHITVFEEKDFIRWCQNDLQDYKEAILRRACTLLLSITNNRKEIKAYSVGENVLFDNLEFVEISYEETKDNGTIFNTCLSDKCLTILYDDLSIVEICDRDNINYASVEFFFNKLSNFITDSVIIEWKLYRGIPLSCIKVENSRSNENGFFPVSYCLLDLVLVIERLTGKRVRFVPEENNTAIISKDSITCYFTTERLESEYVILEQLMKVYLGLKNFKSVDTLYFTDMQNWQYDDETLEIAMHIILQNKFIGIMIAELYPIYNSDMLYSLMNFRISEDYMSSVCRYLCSYSKKNKLCSHCSGIDDIFNKEGECPLYKDTSIMDAFYLIEDISTPEQHEAIVKDLIHNFKLKE